MTETSDYFTTEPLLELTFTIINYSNYCMSYQCYATYNSFFLQIKFITR